MFSDNLYPYGHSFMNDDDFDDQFDDYVVEEIDRLNSEEGYLGQADNDPRNPFAFKDCPNLPEDCHFCHLCGILYNPDSWRRHKTRFANDSGACSFRQLEKPHSLEIHVLPREPFCTNYTDWRFKNLPPRVRTDLPRPGHQFLNRTLRDILEPHLQKIARDRINAEKVPEQLLQCGEKRSRREMEQKPSNVNFFAAAGIFDESAQLGVKSWFESFATFRPKNLTWKEIPIHLKDRFWGDTTGINKLGEPNLTQVVLRKIADLTDDKTEKTMFDSVQEQEVHESASEDGQEPVALYQDDPDEVKNAFSNYQNCQNAMKGYVRQKITERIAAAKKKHYKSMCQHEKAEIEEKIEVEEPSKHPSSSFVSPNSKSDEQTATLFLGYLQDKEEYDFATAFKYTSNASAFVRTYLGLKANNKRFWEQVKNDPVAFKKFSQFFNAMPQLLTNLGGTGVTFSVTAVILHHFPHLLGSCPHLWSKFSYEETYQQFFSTLSKYLKNAIGLTELDTMWLVQNWSILNATTGKFLQYFAEHHVIQDHLISLAFSTHVSKQFAPAVTDADIEKISNIEHTTQMNQPELNVFLSLRLTCSKEPAFSDYQGAVQGLEGFLFFTKDRLEEEKEDFYRLELNDWLLAINKKLSRPHIDHYAVGTYDLKKTFQLQRTVNIEVLKSLGKQKNDWLMSNDSLAQLLTYQNRSSFFYNNIETLKPSNRQISTGYIAWRLAQKCSLTKQLWTVATGQGKSRITAVIVQLFALHDMKAVLAGAAKRKIFLVYCNEYLLKRDREIYDNMWLLLTTYLDLVFLVTDTFTSMQEEGIYIIDECDVFFFGSPASPEKSLNMLLEMKGASRCIMLTATANSSLQSDEDSEGKFLQICNVTRFFYTAKDMVATHQDTEQKATVMKIADPLDYLRGQRKICGVLVYPDQSESSIKELTEQGYKLATEVKDYTLLQHIQADPAGNFPVYILNSDSMRGFDFRTENFQGLLTLLQTAPVGNRRDVRQLYGRVGRFDDKGKIVIKEGVAVFDAALSRELLNNILKLIVRYDWMNKSQQSVEGKISSEEVFEPGKSA